MNLYNNRNNFTEITVDWLTRHGIDLRSDDDLDLEVLLANDINEWQSNRFFRRTNVVGNFKVSFVEMVHNDIGMLKAVLYLFDYLYSIDFIQKDNNESLRELNTDIVNSFWIDIYADKKRPY